MFESTIRDLGLPRAIRTDGSPFASRSAFFGLSKPSVWWLRLGIRIERIKPGNPIPFVPGYEVAGIVDAIADGVAGFQVGQRVSALTVHGGFGEFLVREAEHFVPIPDAVSDVEAAALILNYVTAWQMIHRVARVRPGQTALVTGAAGGVGTATLQLLHLAGLRTYGAASSLKHGTVRKLGATPLDYRAAPIDRLMRAPESQGVDYVFDAIGGGNIGLCIGAARRGGTVVGYGFMSVSGKLAIAVMFFEGNSGRQNRYSQMSDLA